jgi:hypothetical protein
MLRKASGLHFLQIVRRTDTTAIVEEVCRSNENLRTLIIKGWKGEKRRVSIKARVICNLPRHCRELENLTIKRIDINSFKFYRILGETLPNLRKVDFSVPSGALAVFARSCDKLEEVSTSVKLFSFGKFGDANHADIQKFCVKMHETLTVLKLSVYCVGDDGVDSIVKCRHLRTLHMYEASSVSHVGLMKISRLQKLTSLAIHAPELITTNMWIELMGQPSLGRLTYLELCACDSLSKQVLAVMKINCLHLEKMRLFYCRNITKRSVTNIARGFRRLKKVLFTPPDMF